jgi:16S rRNA G966 N2-methylase RsmD
MPNQLFYGDNLEVLRKHIRDETVDLCYIDPPFNSKRNYILNTINHIQISSIGMWKKELVVFLGLAI